MIDKNFAQAQLINGGRKWWHQVAALPLHKFHNDEKSPLLKEQADRTKKQQMQPCFNLM